MIGVAYELAEYCKTLDWAETLINDLIVDGQIGASKIRDAVEASSAIKSEIAKLIKILER
jgi:hypothetical protein